MSLAFIFIFVGNNSKIKIMKKIATLLFTSFLVISGSAQQIGDGHAPTVSDFTIPIKSGVYSGHNAIGGTPDVGNVWQHLFAIRHTSQMNNYQLQIASSFATNDRLFFRKIVSNDLKSLNPVWVEVATRGVNTFTGNQIVNGNVGIGDPTPDIPLSVYGISQFFPSRIGSGDARSLEIGYSFTNPDFMNNLYPVFLKTGGGNQPLILDAARVGIGTSNPDAKLAVNGTIHSKEVKVDLLGWSDFVFKKEYILPTLEEVERHIKEKGHLESIPSEEEVLKNGINLGEMNAKLLQKIEELTLYTIQQSKEIQTLKEENKSFKSLSERLSKIEQQLK
jgi:hypothetical protein